MSDKPNKKTIAIIQARMNSKRLPGKVLMPINGTPMLGFMIERVLSSSEVDELILSLIHI